MTSEALCLGVFKLMNDMVGRIKKKVKTENAPQKTGHVQRQRLVKQMFFRGDEKISV